MISRYTPVTALLLFAAVAYAAKQSPIDIVTEDVVSDSSLSDLLFLHYSTHKSGYTIENSGHGAKISLTDSKSTPYVTGGPLGSDKYNLEQMHFHWGPTAHVGSEHLVDGESFSMEVHLVHYKSDYGNFDDAALESDGLAVIGFFIEGVTSDSGFNRNFQYVVNSVKSVVEPESSSSANKNLLAWVTPYLDASDYWTYEGSLTTSPYSENVQWIVYRSPILIQKSQIDAFRTMEDEHSEVLTENYRDVQDLDGRTVTYVP